MSQSRKIIIIETDMRASFDRQNNKIPYAASNFNPLSGSAQIIVGFQSKYHSSFRQVNRSVGDSRSSELTSLFGIKL